MSDQWLAADDALDLYDRLLSTLEKTRSRLAVAVAAESKAIPPDRWRHYMETAERLRRCVKGLRLRPYLDSAEKPVWAMALRELLQIPSVIRNRESAGEALELCRRLQGVMDMLALSDGRDMPR